MGLRVLWDPVLWIIIFFQELKGFLFLHILQQWIYLTFLTICRVILLRPWLSSFSSLAVSEGDLFKVMRMETVSLKNVLMFGESGLDIGAPWRLHKLFKVMYKSSVFYEFNFLCILRVISTTGSVQQTHRVLLLRLIYCLWQSHRHAQHIRARLCRTIVDFRKMLKYPWKSRLLTDVPCKLSLQVQACIILCGSW